MLVSRFDSWVGKIPWRRVGYPFQYSLDSLGSSVGKESACSVGDLSLIPGLGRSPGGGMATHSGILAWRGAEQPEWAAVHGVTKRWTQLSDQVCNTTVAPETFPQNPRTLRNGLKICNLYLAFTLQVGKLRLQKVNWFSWRLSIG